MNERKIDIYNHVMPRAVADRIRELAPGKGDMVKRVTSIPMLYDIEARVRMMDRWPGYQQVLTLSSPPLETIAGPQDAPELARVANDELKKIPDYALSSAIKLWYKIGTYGGSCGFGRWRATRCNFKRGSARLSLLFFTEPRISAGRR